MIEQQTESSADQPSLRWAKTAPLATSAASPAAECMIEVTCGLPCAEEEEEEEEEAEEEVEAELPSAEKRRVLITLACIRPSTTPRQAEESETPVTT